MLTVRKEQLKALGSEAVLRSDGRLAAYARARFPKRFAGATDAELLAFVSRVRAHARRCGVLRETDVGTFLDLTVMYGDCFDRDAWAAEVLRNPGLHGHDKMVLLRYLVGLSGVQM
jgi:hypothetical protein